MKNLCLNIPAILLLTLAFTPAAEAQSFGSNVAVTANSQVLNGDTVFAYDIYDRINSTSNAVNGVTFSGSLTQNGVTFSATGFPNADTTGASTQTADMSTAFTNVLSYNIYNFGNPVGDDSLTLTGLTTGTTYALQIFDGTRGGAGTNFQTLTDGSASGVLNYGPGTSSTGSPSADDFIVDTFTAGPSQSETINFAGNDDNTVLVNAINLQIVPEPSTWALLVGGFGFLFLLARRNLRRV
jgi:hypothetical protein